MIERARDATLLRVCGRFSLNHYIAHVRPRSKRSPDPLAVISAAENTT